MKISEQIKCARFPCTDTDKNAYALPSADIDVDNIKILMIAEAPPNEKADYFYAAGNPFYLQTTLQAFRDAGADVSSMQGILNLGVYITTAIKCGKTQYAISPESMKNCAVLLEQEIALFPNVKVFMLMGDVAIKVTYPPASWGASNASPQVWGCGRFPPASKLAGIQRSFL